MYKFLELSYSETVKQRKTFIDYKFVKKGNMKLSFSTDEVFYDQCVHVELDIFKTYAWVTSMVTGFLTVKMFIDKQPS